VIGHLVALLTLIKGTAARVQQGQPGRQGAVFDTIDTLHATLRAFAEMVPGIRVDHEAMRRAALQGHSTATTWPITWCDGASRFRDAHEAAARAVRRADELGCALADLPLHELQALAPQIGEGVFKVLTLDGSVAAPITCGTAPRRSPHRSGGGEDAGAARRPHPRPLSRKRERGKS